MIYARLPTEDEQRELKRMARQEAGRVSERVHMVLLSARHKTVPTIADLFEVHPVTVRTWLERFEAEGPSGLYDAERSGRPAKVTPQVQASLVEMVQDDPQQAGYVATLWTVAMLVQALASKLKTKLSPNTVRNWLHALGLRWGRPRLAMPRKVDPHKAQKQWAIAQAVVEAPAEAAVLYADESRLQLLPLIRGAWHWLGEQIRVPTPGTNVPRAILGALNIRTGQWSYLIREQMRKEDFIAFLEHLLVVYPQNWIIVIVDNYSSHTARAVADWLEHHPRLRLYYLPTHCSHLNPVERIWLRLKGQVAANRLYGSIQLLLESVETFFDQMTCQQALRWAAV